mmetsp:Transcript_4721/g.8395  ORF Transcript_4721/g.8395 Transcript_4721/m.8395 type:complete len:577 (+) Transcript_4721:2-1732(+)
MDSKQMLADLLVLAPSVDGLNGTAVIPTASTSSSPSHTNTNNINHLPWSSLISPPLLTCHLDDGRIATNSEFHAASSLYAAGSVAKYPNARTGRAEVAGGRHVSAELAGTVAARNMVGDGSIAPLNQRSEADSLTPCHIQESIPVWRSDVIPYLPAPASNDKDQQLPKETMQSTSASLALYSMGIHALCVGRCDSEGMATHGFWWTNTKQSNESENGNDNGSSKGIGGNSNNDNNGSEKSIRPNAFMRRATRRTNMSNNSKASSSRGSLPVYGSGVIYYLDRSGNIEGVMLWGLPFSADPKDVHSNLNNELVERMKNMIRSNGGAAIRDHSEKILNENAGTNIDVELLSYLHLVEESKYLASMSLSGSASTDLSVSSSPYQERNKTPQSTRVSVLGRPLHRYTPIKAVELTNLGKMHRKDESGHLTEEDDLFYSTTMASTKTSSARRVEESGSRPPSLKRIYPMRTGAGPAALLARTQEYELEKEMKRRQLQIQRSRPPKEEPLWLRQGEEHRFVNRREALAEVFRRNIQLGQFKDGSDAVRQAPVPKVYLDAKEKWKEWTGTEDEEREEGGGEEA